MYCFVELSVGQSKRKRKMHTWNCSSWCASDAFREAISPGFLACCCTTTVLEIVYRKMEWKDLYFGAQKFGNRSQFSYNTDSSKTFRMFLLNMEFNVFLTKATLIFYFHFPQNCWNTLTVWWRIRLQKWFHQYEGILCLAREI